jgi:4-amino-4-deoxychorismate lyase
MSRFIESLACKNGQYPLLDWHQKRVNETFEHFFPRSEPLDLASILPMINQSDLYKVRLEYDQNTFDITLTPYQCKPINSISLIEVSAFEYRYKYADRKNLTELYNQKGNADDIWIVVDGKLTDSYFANVCLWDDERWYTPDSYLLNGVMRQSLIAKGELSERKIHVSDLALYERVCLINALNGLGGLTLSVGCIIR